MVRPVQDASLVVIAFNERVRAPDCVRAILAQQTTATFELIFVDDGSTDATADAALAAAAGDQRFRLVRLDRNRGRGAARAAGVEAARGRAIGFVDADITVPRDWLARCLTELPGHAAVGGIAVPDGDATVLARVSGAKPRVVAGSMPITGNNVLFDATVLAQSGFDPRDRLGEDFRLAARLLREGQQLQRVPGLIVHHDESKSYSGALRWRYVNGVDASSHPREFGRVRLADVVWAGWLGSWLVAIVGAMAWSPWWIMLGVAASTVPGIAHAVSRFERRPVGRFVVACALDIPLLAAYLVGRTVGMPRLLRGRMAA